MKTEFRIALIYGLAQFLLSIAIWGGFEHSIMSGDMIQNTEASFWAFVSNTRLISYLCFSVVNVLLFGIFSLKFSSIFHPGYGSAVFLAVGTVAFAIPLLLNSAFQVPYLLAPVFAFIAVSAMYGLISRVISEWKSIQ